MLLGDLEVRRGADVLLRLEVEIAQTTVERARGLMNVNDLPENRGMAFLFEQTTRSPFWMKETKIPLDIAFWDAGSLIVGVQQMDPCAEDPCPLYQPNADYIGALEANAGVLSREGVRVGDRILLRKRSLGKAAATA